MKMLVKFSNTTIQEAIGSETTWPQGTMLVY
jgi:hypothetical protein